MTFNTLARADTFIVEGDHDLYRVWKIPGRRDSDYYDGSGIKKTYNLANNDRRWPPDEDACPSLMSVKIGNIDKKILRKNVQYLTLYCPECGVEGKSESSGEKFCPECGLVLSSTDAKFTDHHEEAGFHGQPISRTANDAGRYQND